MSIILIKHHHHKIDLRKQSLSSAVKICRQFRSFGKLLIINIALNKYELIFRKAVVKKNMADKNICLRMESETEEEFVESVEEEETDDTMPQGT